jgi:hypothetical protein
LLEGAEDPGAVFVRHFDQFSTDIERRFLQTVGAHKALAAVCEALPHSDSGVWTMRNDAAWLLRGCVLDYERMTETFFDCDLRGLPLERGIRKLSSAWAKRAQTMCALPTTSTRCRHLMIRRSSS